VLWASARVHGAELHAFLAFGLMAGNGTLMPSSGTLKVWPTPLPAFESIKAYGAPFNVELATPVTEPTSWLRSGLPPSYCRIVTLMVVCAGSCHRVVFVQTPAGVSTR